jgi:hypothetical protein
MPAAPLACDAHGLLAQLGHADNLVVSRRLIAAVLVGGGIAVRLGRR